MVMSMDIAAIPFSSLSLRGEAGAPAPGEGESSSQPRNSHGIPLTLTLTLTLSPRGEGSPHPNSAALLQIWLSPAFPVGAFAYSHGLETAAANGWVQDGETLERWLRDVVELGALRNDLILLAEAWRATSAGDRDALACAAELALALQPSSERYLETTTQGTAFLAQIEAAWPCPALQLLQAARDREVSYPIAVGVAAAGHGSELRRTLVAYGLGFIGNLVSASIRLSVIGQTDGQRVIAALLPDIEAAAMACESSSLDDLGGAGFASDLASMRHETQYTRLFRS